MNAGELRKRVILQVKTVTRSASGEETITWSDHATVWASIEPLQGREYFTAQKEQSEVTTRIRIRFRRNITSEWRVKESVKRIYLIETIIDPDERHRHLELMCREIKAA